MGVKIGVIGIGNWGRNLLRSFCQLSDAEVRWCCDIDESRWEALSPQYPGITFTKKYHDIFQDRETEAVVVATPATTHYEISKGALGSGKHIFVEKPFVLRSREAEELISLSEKVSRKIMVGHIMQYHPAVEKLKKLIEHGELGNIYYLYSQRVNLGVIRNDENALWSLGPHDVSMVLYLLGQVPSHISTQGQSFLQEKVEDVVFLTLYFPSKTFAQIQMSWLDPHKERKLTIVGDKKMVVFDDMQPVEKIKIFDKGITWKVDYSNYGEFLSIRNGDIYIPYVMPEEPLKIECQHFIDCIKNGKVPRSDGKEGSKVVKVLEAAEKSLRQGGSLVSLKEIS